jgi:hypothetical protein
MRVRDFAAAAAVAAVCVAGSVHVAEAAAVPGLGGLLNAVMHVASRSGEAPLGQAGACRAAVEQRAAAGGQLRLTGVVGHDCGRRAGLSRREARWVRAAVESWAARD